MSYVKRLLTAVVLALVLGAWGSCSQVVKQPEKIYIEVEKKQDIPDDLLKDCPIEQPTKTTVDEAVRVAAARKQALIDCNADKAALRKIDKQ